MLYKRLGKKNNNYAYRMETSIVQIDISFFCFFFPKSYDYDMPVIVSRQPLADVYKEENNLISFKSLFVFFWF